MEERRLIVNGINLHVLVDGEGPPVLLLHGFPDTARLWRHVMPRLVAANFRVIAFDQRGYGQSDAPKEVREYETSKIVADAVGVIKELGITEKVRLVGHDWGALIGWLLCLKHPELFARFVAVSVGHPLAYRNAGFKQRLKGWYVLAFQVPGIAERIISFNNYRILRKISQDPEDTAERTAAFSRPGRLTAAINWYRANFWTLLAVKHGQCGVPTMGIYSTGDIALTEDQMVDSQKYMNADWKYVNIPNSSHWIPLDQAEQLSEHLIKWFS